MFHGREKKAGLCLLLFVFELKNKFFKSFFLEHGGWLNKIGDFKCI